MKVISILQPWASLVVLGHKKIETRSWKTKYRGELLIHASRREIKLNEIGCDILTRVFKDCIPPNKYTEIPYGAIIGKVNLIAVVTTEELGWTQSFSDGYSTEWSIQEEINQQERAFGDYSPNRFCWLLSHPVLFDKPIPAKGQLGIWNWESENK